MAAIEPAVRAAVKDIGYEQDKSTMRILSFKIICMNNLLILRWELIRVVTKMKAPEIKA